MPRAMSLRMRDHLRIRTYQEPQHLGARLGAAMLKYNVPAPALAEYLQVSTDTIYRWAYEGPDVPQARRADVRFLLSSLRHTLRDTSLAGTVDVRTRIFHQLFSDARR
jgi:predicted DNA-binding transcriptional regulator AlpA